MLSQLSTTILLRRMFTHKHSFIQSPQFNLHTLYVHDSWTSCELRTFCYRRTPATLSRYLDVLVATWLTPVSWSWLFVHDGVHGVLQLSIREIPRFCHNLHLGTSVIRPLDHLDARSRNSDVVLTPLQPLGSAV